MFVRQLLTARLRKALTTTHLTLRFLCVILCDLCGKALFLRILIPAK